MNLAALLNDYLKGIGRDDHSGSSEGSLFEITLNDVLSIRVSELAGPPTMICLQYEVGSVPLDADSDFFRRCLHANFRHEVPSMPVSPSMRPIACWHCWSGIRWLTWTANASRLCSKIFQLRRSACSP